MADSLLPPDPPRLGNYQVLGRLGAGGQGVVYLGQAPTGAQVAIKTLTMDPSDDPNILQRFAREAEAARQVASFCTAAIIDADFTANPPYIVSEYVAGPSIAESVRSRGPLTGGDLHRVAVAMATALMAIHEAGIVHRDLKPANVLLGDGGARVIDFGVARVSRGTGTETNTSIGTPAFMAPEQIAGDTLSPKADVFAWGAVVAFAASGRQPFDGDSVPAVLHQVLNQPPDLSGVPDSLRELVTAALSKDPNQRPSSTDVLMTLIGRTERPSDHEAATQVLRAGAASATSAMPGTAPTAVPPAPPTQTQDSTRGPDSRRSRGPLIGAAAGGLAVGLLVGMLLGWVLSPSGEPAESAGGDTAEDQDPPADNEQDDAAAAADESNNDDSGDDGDTDEESPDQAPRFPTEYDDSWAGQTPGMEWEASFEEGERSGTLENDDCEYDLLLTEATDDGFVSEFGSEDLGCRARGATLALDGGLLTMEVDVDMSTETIQFERD